MRYEEEEKVQKPRDRSSPHTYEEQVRRPAPSAGMLRFQAEV